MSNVAVVWLQYIPYGVAKMTTVSAIQRIMELRAYGETRVSNAYIVTLLSLMTIAHPREVLLQLNNCYLAQYNSAEQFQDPTE